MSHSWDATLYTTKHSFVADYGASLVELLAPKSYEHILDLGCGTGELTAKIGMSCHKVVGLDSSKAMLDKASQQFPHLELVQQDATNFSFDTPFDAIFSNAALHWVTDYTSAAQSMYRNLAKGGRVVLEMGGKGNILAITTALRGALVKWGYGPQARLEPWYFPSVAEYAGVLEQEGFTVTMAQWYARPTLLESEENGLADWLCMFAKSFFLGVATHHVPEIIQAVANEVREQLFREGSWHADYKRLRVIAFKNQ